MDTITRSRTHRTRPDRAHVPALPFATTLFAFGPTWTVLAALALARDGVWMGPDLFTGATLGALIGLWAPHPASLPALWMQDARDGMLRGRGQVSRALLLVPALLVRPGTRLATAAQLAGLAVGLVMWATATV